VSDNDVTIERIDGCMQPDGRLLAASTHGSQLTISLCMLYILHGLLDNKVCRIYALVQGGPKNLAPFFSVRLNFTKY